MSSTEQPGAEPDAALVERVARALCLADPSADAPDPDDEGFGVYDGPAWHCWADDARAAIAAMQPELEAAREAGRRQGLEQAAQWHRTEADECKGLAAEDALANTFRPMVAFHVQAYRHFRALATPSTELTP